MPATRPLRERLVEKLDTSGDCWLFTGARAPGGYGRIGYRQRTMQAHRAAYETFVGPIPAGLHIDHLCGNRACCNPGHLEPVTQAENNRRANRLRFAHMTHCQRGHEFTAANTGTRPEGRYCRTCHNASARARRARLKESVDV